MKTRLISVVLLLLFSTAVYADELKSEFAKFGDAKVHYVSMGKGDEALVFVHGWTCSAEFWRGQMNAFPGVRVIAVDLAGHGLSAKPRVNYTMDYFARSIDAVLRDAKVKRAVLVGHSMGTPVVRQYYRLFPERTLGLVIVDGALRSVVPKEQMEQFLRPLRTNYKVAAPQMIDQMLMPVKDPALKDQIRAAMLSTPDYVAISAMDAMADEKNYEKDPIKVPVLAVLAKSPFWPPDTETFLRSLAPTLEYEMWDGVSHFLMMEKPDQFNKSVQAFLTKNSLLLR